MSPGRRFLFVALVLLAGAGLGQERPVSQSLSSDLTTNSIRTVAGNGSAGFGGDGGSALEAFLSPGAVAVDASGNLYTTDGLTHRIRRVDASGVITTFAGTGVPGFAGDGGPALSAQLNGPKDIEIDAAGNLFFVDTNNNRVRKITPAGQISTVAGTGTAGFGGDGGPATLAHLNHPEGLGLDALGNLFIADSSNYRIRVVNPNGIIGTVAGTGTAGFFGDGGAANIARLTYPGDVTATPNGDLLVVDSSRVRRIAVSGIITTVAGNGGQGSGAEGVPATSTPANPGKVAIDSQGNFFFSEATRVRRVDPNGIVRTVAGGGSGPYKGDGGPATSASLQSVVGIAISPGGDLYIIDGNQIRVVSEDLAAASGGTPALVSISPPVGPQGATITANLTGFNLTSVTGIIFSGSGVTASIESGGTSVLLPIKISIASNAATVPRTVTLVAPYATSRPFLAFNILPTPGGQIQTIAGNGAAGFVSDGVLGQATSLNLPRGVVSDTSGNIYFSDTANNRVRRISPLGVITTIAGTGVAGYNGENILGTTAQLSSPMGLAIDTSPPYDRLYIADTLNHRIRKLILPYNLLNDVVGTGVAGYNGEDKPALAAQLNAPADVWLDKDGNILIADTGNHRIRKSGVGNVTTVAGNGSAGYNGDGIPGQTSSLNSPSGVTSDSAGNVYIADTASHRIRKVSPAGTISTIAGLGSAGLSGDSGSATSALLSSPAGVTMDGNDLYIADTGNSRVRRIRSGVITTVAGTSAGFGGDGGLAVSALLDAPTSVAVDALHNLYIVDTGNQRVRLVSGTTIPGTPEVQAISRTVGIQGTTVRATIVGKNLNGATAVNFTGGGVTVTILDGGTSSSVPVLITIVPGAAIGARTFNVDTSAGAAPYFSGFSVVSSSSGDIIETIVGVLSSYTSTGDGGSALAATLQEPQGLALDATGNLFIADASGHRVRKVSPDGIITTVAGTGQFGFSGDGGPATSAQLDTPWDVAVDGSGNLYIGEKNNARVRRVDGTTGVIMTVAGNGVLGYSGDEGPAISASIGISGVSLDSAGDLHIVSGTRIRKVTSDGIIHTVVGTGVPGYSGDGGPATAAQINGATRIAFDNAGNMLIAELQNSVIRKVANGTITTIAGTGAYGFSGDGGPALSAEFRAPTDLAVDPQGNIFITDYNNYRIRKIDTAGNISTLAGGVTFGANPGEGVPADSVQLFTNFGLEADGAGNVYVTNMSRVRRITRLPAVVPSIAGISPTSGAEGSTVSATITGTNLRGVSEVVFSGTGVKGKVSANRTNTSLPITITVAPSASSGARTLTAITSSSVSTPFSSFTVDQTALPNILSFDPPTGVQGSAVAGTITGINLSGATGVTFSGAGVSAVINGAQTDTSIPLMITTAPDAAIGPRTVTVTTSGSPSAPFNGFTVGPALPVITAVIPPSAAQGDVVSATISGSNLTGVTAVAISSAGVSATIGSGRTDTNLPITITIDRSASPGARTVKVATPYKTSDEFSGFTVTTNNVPYITSVRPGASVRGVTFVMEIGGLSLGGASAVTFSGTGVTASIQPGGTATRVPLTVTVAPDAPTGIRTVTLTTPGGDSNAFSGFTVLSDNPVGISSMVPSSAEQGTSFNATLLGRGLGGTSAVVFSGTGVTATVLGGVTSTQVPLQITVAPDAALGMRTVSVTASLGTFNGFTGFKVLPATIPSLVSTLAGTGAQGFSGDNGPGLSATFNGLSDVAVDGAGNVYIADAGNYRIRKLSIDGTITTIAGNGSQGLSGDGGPALSAQFHSPGLLAVDGVGNLYVAETYQCRIRKITPNGIITTIAGNGTSGYAGDGGPAVNAQLAGPNALTADIDGNVYVADGNLIRKINLGGIITTVAGSNPTGQVGFSGDGGLATLARLNSPNGIAVDLQGRLFISDYGNRRIRMVDAAGIISTIAGTGVQDFRGDGDPATTADLYSPISVKVDNNGNVFFSDSARVRMIDQNGVINTVAGNGSISFSGDGGPATSAGIAVGRIALDGAGNIVIASDRRIRRVAFTRPPNEPTIRGLSTFYATQGASVSAMLTGTVLTGATLVNFSGTGVTASIGVGGTSTSLPLTINIAADATVGPRTVTVSTANGTSLPFRYFMATSAAQPALIGAVQVPFGFIGTSVSAQIYGQYLTGANAVTFSGAGVSASISGGGTDTALPIVISISATAPPGTRTMTVAKSNGSTAPFNGFTVLTSGANGIITTLAGNGQFAFSGDGGPAAAASLQFTRGVVADAAGNVYLADRDNRRVRKVATNGVITTFAGTGARGFSGDGGPATAAQLDTPWDLALDSSGNLYISDIGVSRVRRVTPGGTISTVAGNGNNGFTADGGSATSAISPNGIAVDPAGNLYFSEFNRVRKVSSGMISTVAGTASSGFSGDDGPATAAKLQSPDGLAFDSAGNLFIADRSNNLIRKVTPGGTISTIAGTPGFVGFGGDGGPATSAYLKQPNAVAVDSQGNLYIADTQNHRVRVVGTDGIIRTVAGVGVAGFGGDLGTPLLANLNNPSSVAVDPFGNLYIGDLANDRVRKVTFLPGLSSSSGTGGPGTSFTITLTGTRLVNLISAVFSGTGVTATIQPGGTATSVTLLVTVAPDAASGPRTLTLTRSDGTSTALAVDTGGRRPRGQITSQ